MSTTATTGTTDAVDPQFFDLLLQNAALHLSTQAIANHQTSAHLMDLSFIDKAVKMDLAESFAAQGLAASQLPRDAVGATVASGGYPAQDRTSAVKAAAATAAAAPGATAATVAAAVAAAA